MAHCVRVPSYRAATHFPPAWLSGYIQVAAPLQYRCTWVCSDAGGIDIRINNTGRSRPVRTRSLNHDFRCVCSSSRMSVYCHIQVSRMPYCACTCCNYQLAWIRGLDSRSTSSFDPLQYQLHHAPVTSKSNLFRVHKQCTNHNNISNE
jgi:hypothetical protein